MPFTNFRSAQNRSRSRSNTRGGAGEGRPPKPPHHLKAMTQPAPSKKKNTAQKSSTMAAASAAASVPPLALGAAHKKRNSKTSQGGSARSSARHGRRHISEEIALNRLQRWARAMITQRAVAKEHNLAQRVEAQAEREEQLHLIRTRLAKLKLSEFFDTAGRRRRRRKNNKKNSKSRVHNAIMNAAESSPQNEMQSASLLLPAATDTIEAFFLAYVSKVEAARRRLRQMRCAARRIEAAWLSSKLYGTLSRMALSRKRQRVLFQQENIERRDLIRRYLWFLICTHQQCYNNEAMRAEGLATRSFPTAMSSLVLFDVDDVAESLLGTAAPQLTWGTGPYHAYYVEGVSGEEETIRSYERRLFFSKQERQLLRETRDLAIACSNGTTSSYTLGEEGDGGWEDGVCQAARGGGGGGGSGALVPFSLMDRVTSSSFWGNKGGSYSNVHLSTQQTKRDSCDSDGEGTRRVPLLLSSSAHAAASVQLLSTPVPKDGKAPLARDAARASPWFLHRALEEHGHLQDVFSLYFVNCRRHMAVGDTVDNEEDGATKREAMGDEVLVLSPETAEGYLHEQYLTSLQPRQDFMNHLLEKRCGISCTLKRNVTGALKISGFTDVNTEAYFDPDASTSRHKNKNSSNSNSRMDASPDSGRGSNSTSTKNSTRGRRAARGFEIEDPIDDFAWDKKLPPPPPKPTFPTDLNTAPMWPYIRARDAMGSGWVDFLQDAKLEHNVYIDGHVATAAPRGGRTAFLCAAAAAEDEGDEEEEEAMVGARRYVGVASPLLKPSTASGPAQPRMRLRDMLDATRRGPVGKTEATFAAEGDELCASTATSHTAATTTNATTTTSATTRSDAVMVACSAAMVTKAVQSLSYHMERLLVQEEVCRLRTAAGAKAVMESLYTLQRETTPRVYTF